jgi:AcrR family transcriptional regulator
VEQILEGAARVFAERGYAGGTTNHIAERAGVSVGSLYQYFPNKEAILVALVERHMRSAAGALEAMITRALDEGWALETMLDRLVRAAVALHASEPKLHHVLIYEAPHPPSVVALLHELEDTMARGVERLLTERAGITVRHARHAAYLLVHVVDALAHELVLHPPEDMDEEAFVAEVVTMLGAYLRAPCPSRSD